MYLRKALPIALLCLALASTATSSGSYAHIDDNELWREADIVVIGTVTSITEEAAAAETHRTVEIGVERYLKNPSESPTLQILYSVRSEAQLGDAVATHSEVTDLGFSVGERVLVFLEKTYPDSYGVYGGIQGKYSFIDGRAVNQLGRVMDIPAPTPLSTIITLVLGVGAIALIIAYIGRDTLSR